MEKNSPQVNNSNTGLSESRQVRPIANLAGIATNVNPLRNRWGWAFENEKLVPTRRANTTVWGCYDGTFRPKASDRRE